MAGMAPDQKRRPSRLHARLARPPSGARVLVGKFKNGHTLRVMGFSHTSPISIGLRSGSMVPIIAFVRSAFEGAALEVLPVRDFLLGHAQDPVGGATQDAVLRLEIF